MIIPALTLDTLTAAKVAFETIHEKSNANRLSNGHPNGIQFEKVHARSPDFCPAFPDAAHRHRSKLFG
jgi:hypothetical protein